MTTITMTMAAALNTAMKASKGNLKAAARILAGSSRAAPPGGRDHRRDDAGAGLVGTSRGMG
jgi:hypothetical protein